MKSSYFRFLELTMAVILGSLLLSVPESLVSARNFWGNLQASLLLVNVCAFLEMYIILSRYHRGLGLDYPAMMLFFEFIIGILFLVSIELIKASKTNLDLIEPIWVLVVIYLGVLIRQAFNFWSALHVTPDRFKQLDFQMRNLVAPIINNFIAIGLLFCMRRAIVVSPQVFFISTERWASIFLISYAVHFLITYMFKLRIRRANQYQQDKYHLDDD